MKKTPKYLFIVTIGIAALFATIWIFRQAQVEADFVTVNEGPLLVTINEDGKTRVRDRFIVSAPLAGRVLRIELEPGDPVVANETILATFQPNDPTLLDTRTRAATEAQVSAATAQLGRANVSRERVTTELMFAKSDLDRRQKLASNNLISKEELQLVELRAQTLSDTLQEAEFAVQSAEHELEVARSGLLFIESTSQDLANEDVDSMVLRSPISGVVLRRLRESEGLILAGEPLLEVADPTKLEIVSDLLSSDAVRIRTTNPVLIEQWGGEGVLRGHVRRIEPAGFTKISALGVEEQRVNVVIDVENTHEVSQILGDGYQVEVRIVIWEGEVPKIPISSLFRYGQEWAVFAFREGKAKLQIVEIGQRNNIAAEIISGLDIGEQVIVYPSDSIEDGVPLKAR